MIELDPLAALIAGALGALLYGGSLAAIVLRIRRR